MTKTMMMIGAAAMALAGLSGAAFAQRDPAYAAAREAKEVGEQPDGYLGVVKGGPAIQALVRDINIKRKAAYTQSAQANGSTVEQFAFTTGCNLEHPDDDREQRPEQHLGEHRAEQCDAQGDGGVFVSFGMHRGEAPLDGRRRQRRVGRLFKR